MSRELELLGIAVDEIADLAFAWSGSVHELHAAAIAKLDDEERAACSWVRDRSRMVVFLKRVGIGNAAVQFHQNDRRVFVVSRDHTFRPPVEPHPRVNEGQSAFNCAHCGIHIDTEALDVPISRTSEGHLVHEICVDLWRTLPMAKRDARPTAEPAAA